MTALGYWAQIVVTAIQKGFCGALSTVSTLVNEVSMKLDTTICKHLRSLGSKVQRTCCTTTAALTLPSLVIQQIVPCRHLSAAEISLHHEIAVFCAQIHAMFEVYPDHFHAYVYPFISIGAAWLIGLVVYGAAAWAHM